MKNLERRKFISNGLKWSAAAFMTPWIVQACKGQEGNDEDNDQSGNNSPLSSPWFQISLAQYSLHRTIGKGEIDNKDFPRIAKEEFGISAVEWLNKYFKDKAKDTAYLSELNTICRDLDVKQLLIMIDGEGDLGNTSERGRKEAVLNHFKWVDAAAHLGCHSIRVNARGNGTSDQIKETAADGLSRLGEYAKDFNINILVENHGGYSSDGEWLSSVIKMVGMENVGTLPDFGNFCIVGRPQGSGDCEEPYDRYKGVKELMPFAKGLSAKSYTFDENGQETTIDYKKMLDIVKQTGYSGFIGIEYEGKQLGEFDGIRATKSLLEKYQLS